MVVDLPPSFFASYFELEDLVRRDNRNRKKAKRFAEPLSVDLSNPKEHVQNDSHCAVDLNVSPSEHQSENNSEDLDSEILEGTKHS